MAEQIRRPDTAFSLDPSDKAQGRKNWTDRLFDDRPGAVKLECAGCGVPIFIPPSQVGQRAHCSLECKKSHPSPKVGAWASRIWEKRDGTVERDCEGCGRTMHLPPSKIGRQFCTQQCRMAATKSRLTKNCLSCGTAFLADNNKSKYCSQKCNAASGRISSPENLAKAQAGRRRAMEEGRIVFASGPDHPMWMGGPSGLRERQIESGKAAAWTRRYRKNNPDKVREFTARRKDRKLGRLPYGSLVKLRRNQADKCAICRTRLKGGGHLDHILPLAKGGKHEPANLQFLCAPCNLHKSDRDPIEHMQSLGRLL